MTIDKTNKPYPKKRPDKGPYMLPKIKQGFGVNNALGVVVFSFNVMAHFRQSKFCREVTAPAYKTVVIFTDVEVVFN